ncbi:MAG: cytochrome P450, partial [Pseudomonadota bacterium]
ARGPVLYWQDYEMPAAFDHASIHALLRDRRLGRAVPREVPDHLQAWSALEQYSLLELEPPEHTNLRARVLRAFTSARVARLAPEIEGIAAELIARLPSGPFDVIAQYCTALPVRVIARLLGVPEAAGPDLLRWSGAMVAMYQAGRTRAVEDAAEAAAKAFTAFIQQHIAAKRAYPSQDLISHLAAQRDLPDGALCATCVLLLNAGHEATVHTLGNAVRTVIAAGHPTITNALVEEALRYDPPLHVFTRRVYQPVEVPGATLTPGQDIALVLGAAGRDPLICPEPDLFNPLRAAPHLAFGGGLHFCLGAALARLELQIGLTALFAAYPNLRLAQAARYADSYHFHKHDQLIVQGQCPDRRLGTRPAQPSCPCGRRAFWQPIRAALWWI